MFACWVGEPPLIIAHVLLAPHVERVAGRADVTEAANGLNEEIDLSIREVRHLKSGEREGVRYYTGFDVLILLLFVIYISDTYFFKCRRSRHNCHCVARRTCSLYFLNSFLIYSGVMFDRENGATSV